MASRTLFEVGVVLDTAQVKAAVAELTAELKGLHALPAATAERTLATRGGEVAQYKQFLTQSGAPKAALDELTKYLKLATKTYGDIVGGGNNVKGAQQKYAEMLTVAAKQGSLPAVGGVRSTAPTNQWGWAPQVEAAKAKADRAEVRASSAAERLAIKEAQADQEAENRVLGKEDPVAAKKAKAEAVKKANERLATANKDLSVRRLEEHVAKTRLENAQKDLSSAKSDRKNLDRAAGTVAPQQKTAATKKVRAAEESAKAAEAELKAAQSRAQTAKSEVDLADKQKRAAENKVVSRTDPSRRTEPRVGPTRHAGGSGGTGPPKGPPKGPSGPDEPFNPQEFADDERAAAEARAIRAKTLAGDAGYIRAVAEETAAVRQTTAAVEAGTNKILSSNQHLGQYAQDLATARVARKKIDLASDTLTEKAYASDPAFAAGAGNLAALRQKRAVQENLAEERILAADKDLAKSTGELAALRRRREIAERTAFLKASAVDAEGEARLASSERARAAGIGAAGVGLRKSDPVFALQELQTIEQQAVIEAQKTLDTSRQRARTQQLLVADEAILVQNQASIQAAEAQRKIAVQEQVRIKLGSAFIDKEVANQVAETANAERRRLGVIQATLRNDNELLAINTQRLVQSKVLQETERQLAAATTRQFLATGQIPSIAQISALSQQLQTKPPRGSVVQRIQASVAARQGGALRLPQDFATGPQLVKGSLLTTARFAASGALLYGGFRVIKDTIKAAEELEVELGILRAQFDSLEASGAGVGAGYSKTRDEIFKIARESGTATEEAVKLGIAFAGAFGPDVGTKVLDVATKIGVIAGIPTPEIFNDLVASVKAFSDADPVTGIQELADVSTQLRNVTGVPQTELLDFLGRVGPVAKTAGLSMKEAAAAGAALLQGSGVGGAGLGEQFGRILTGFQDQTVQIAELVGGNKDLRSSIAQGRESRGGSYAGFSKDLQAGDASVLLDLAQGFEKLGESQKRQILASVGSRREGQTLAVLLRNSSTYIRAYDQALVSAGAADRDFARRQATLQFQVKRLGVEFQQFALRIYDSGLKSFLVGVVQTGRVVVLVFSGMLKVLSSINRIALNGFLGQLGVALVGVRALYGVLGTVAKIGVGGVLAKGGGAVRGVISPAAGPLIGSAVALDGSAAALTGAAAALTGAAQVGAAGGLLGPNGQPLGRVGQSVVPAVRDFRAGAISPLGRSAFGANASARLAAFGLTKFNIALAGSVVVLQRYLSTTGAVSRAGDAFRQQLRNMTDEEVKAIASRRSSTFNAFATNLFGESTKDIKAKDEQRRRHSLKLDLPNKAAVIPDLLDGLDEDQIFAVADALKVNLGKIDRGNKALQKVFPLSTIDIYGNPDDTASAHLFEQDPTEIAKDLAKALDTGMSGAEEVATAVLDAVNTIPGIAGKSAAAIAKLIETKTGEAVAADFNSEDSQIKADLEALKAQLEAGDISAAQYIRALKANRDLLLAAVNHGLDPDGKIATAIGEADADIQLAESKAVAQAHGFQQKLLALAGGTPQQQLDLAIKALNDPTLTDPKARQSIVEDILQYTEALLQLKASTIDDAAEKAAFLKAGIPIPDEARAEILKQAIGEIDPVWGAFLTDTFDSLIDQAKFVEDVVAYALEQGVAIVVAAQAVLDGMAAEARRLNPRADGWSALGAFTPPPTSNVRVPSNLPDYNVDVVRADPSTGGSTRDDAAQKARDYRLALLDLRRSEIEGDAVAEAELDRQVALEEQRFARETGDRAGEVRAQAALNRAARARSDALDAISKGERELALAQRGDDPVGQAYNDLIDANHAVNIARGAAARLAAQAAAVRAQRALADAFADIGNAQIELAQAMADAAGDTILSAQLALELAEKQLADLIKKSPNDEAAILRGRAAVVSARAARRDAELNEKTRAIDVALQLEQITTAQAIQQLQALLQIPELTQEEIDNLLLKIKSLQDGLSADFRFNLPTGIKLPTAYESRRLDQTATGSGYNDNRVITVTVNAETNADPQAIATAVLSAVGEPNRTGTVSKRY